MHLRLILRALAFNLDAHRSNLPNLIAGAVGMFINNIIFFAGIWGMLFAGKNQNTVLIPYFIALYSIVTAAWGFVNFFFGGLRLLGEFIAEGTLEPMLATPQDPILLAGISHSSPIALGDIIMGLMGIGLLAAQVDPSMAIRSIAAAFVSTVGFAGLFIFAGSLSFFIPRGNHVSQLLIEIFLSLSVYPTGKMFSGIGRTALLLTPAAATALLPLEAVENANLKTMILSLGAALGFLAFSIGMFRLGLKHYRAVSLIGAQR